MGKKIKKIIKVKSKGLKAKDVEKLNNLYMKHPGDLTDKDKKTIATLEAIRAKEGDAK